MILPTLYKLTSTGKIQMWKIEVFTYQGDDSVGIIKTTYGLKDGKQQVAHESITEGKNLGKSNETTPFQQAEAEALAQWEKKKKGYKEKI